jgi:hypothetical protein
LTVPLGEFVSRNRVVTPDLGAVAQAVPSEWRYSLFDAAPIVELPVDGCADAS